jgi:hypothetical protein
MMQPAGHRGMMQGGDSRFMAAEVRVGAGVKHRKKGFFL